MPGNVTDSYIRKLNNVYFSLLLAPIFEMQNKVKVSIL